MSQSARRMLPAQVGIGGGHEPVNRIDYELEAERDRVATMLLERIRKHISLAAIVAFSKPANVDRFEHEAEMALHRIVQLGTK